MGGLVIRDAVQARGLGGYARTAVTIATPHAGTSLARFVPGPAARQMRPGSEFLADLAGLHADDRTRWVMINGTADRVVRHSSLISGIQSTRAVHLHQSAAGHGSIARHPAVVADIVTALVAAEEEAQQAVSLAA